MTKHKPDSEQYSDQEADDILSEDLAPKGELSDLEQQLILSEQKVNEHWERILRMQADADNASRRSERDVSNAHKYALEKFASELLPIVDSLELCLINTPESMREANKAVLDGVDLTLKMFYTAMEKFGIKQVNPVGDQFNPEFEQAISVQPDADAAPGTVLSVLQKGYTLNGRLLRPALVAVSKAIE